MAGQSRLECRRPFPFVTRDSEVVREAACLLTLVIPAQAGIQVNDADKHRQVSIFWVLASFERILMNADVCQITPQSPDPLTMNVALGQRIEGKTQLFDVPVTEFSDRGKVYVDARFRFDFVFGDTPSIATGRNVGATLTAIRDEIQTILKKFTSVPVLQ